MEGVKLEALEALSKRNAILEQYVLDLRECILNLCEEKREWRQRALELERRVKILDDPETVILHHSVTSNDRKRANRLEDEMRALKALLNDPNHARQVLHIEAQRFLGDPRESVTIKTSASAWSTMPIADAGDT